MGRKHHAAAVGRARRWVLSLCAWRSGCLNSCNGTKRVRKEVKAENREEERVKAVPVRDLAKARRTSSATRQYSGKVSCEGRSGKVYLYLSMPAPEGASRRWWKSASLTIGMGIGSWFWVEPVLSHHAWFWRDVRLGGRRRQEMSMKILLNLRLTLRVAGVPERGEDVARHINEHLNLREEVRKGTESRKNERTFAWTFKKRHKRHPVLRQKSNPLATNGTANRCRLLRLEILVRVRRKLS
ncbi:hypothetical protein BDP27DRAFT_273750 [Rhodocollybia butyracea]|uniref:Uncharacterized protein n=1 Tax=Rhodocollybia butyracea TaxID=206335 RepID=A0A9P5U2M3_9AGAR|nr:hypothetical protein BDP27DRAFT_273750 [Rhodocollybia butyracea]